MIRCEGLLAFVLVNILYTLYIIRWILSWGAGCFNLPKLVHITPALLTTGLWLKYNVHMPYIVKHYLSWKFWVDPNFELIRGANVRVYFNSITLLYKFIYGRNWEFRYRCEYVLRYCEGRAVSDIVFFASISIFRSLELGYRDRSAASKEFSVFGPSYPEREKQDNYVMQRRKKEEKLARRRSELRR